jgi:hypothetical protein
VRKDSEGAPRARGPPLLVPKTKFQFDLFSPTPLLPKCVTYVRRGTTAVQCFTDGDSFLELVVTIGETSFSLLNFYSPGHPKHVAKLLTTRFPMPPEACILLGDLNAHHPSWSTERDLESAACRKASRDSEVLAEWLERHQFTLHNEPGIPTYFPDRIGDSQAMPSVIDLALSRGAIRDQITSWAIDEAPPSDHRTIALYLSVDDIVATEPARYRDWRNANWHLFNDDIRHLDLDHDKLEPSGGITAILRAISEAMEVAVPLKTRRHKLRIPWWYPELDRMRTRVKRAERCIRNNPNPTAEARLGFWSLEKQWRLMLENAREDYNIPRLAETDHRNVWRTLKQHNAHRSPIPPIDGVEDFQAKCDAFRNALFLPADDSLEVLPPNFVSSKADLRDEFHLVSRAEVDHVITRLNYGSAVGPDKISYEAVRRFHACLPHALPRIFTDLFASATHPTEWKAAHCVVIPKPGKSTYQTASAYRPISLLSCFGKVFEAIAARRLSKAAAACGAIGETQMGACAQHSALDTLLRVVDPVAYSLSQLHSIAHSQPPRPGLLTHDIEGTFNNTHPALLDQVMEQRRIPTYLRNWTRAFNKDRRLGFALDSRIEEPRPFRCGLPHGSPVSPVLFLIYANAALEGTNRTGAITDTSYIDDVSIVATASRPNAVIEVLQTRTDEQLRRAESLRLSFATGKSELLLFLPPYSNCRTDLSRSKMPLSQKQTIDLTVADRVVRPSRHLKYLGVTIDDDLGFRTHAAIAAPKGIQAVGALGFLRRHDWSVPAYVAHHLALVAVMPKMMWGSPIWWTGSAAVRSLLETTYNRIARWITGLPMSTRISKLLTAAQMPPMDAYLDYLSMRYAIRLKFLPADHILADQPTYICGKPKLNFPSKHRLDTLIAHRAVENLEDRYGHAAASIPRIASPQPDKHTDPTGIHERWIQSLPDFTIHREKKMRALGALRA